MSIIGISKKQWHYANIRVEEIANRDAKFQRLSNADKNYAIAVSAGWPIANGSALMIDLSEEGIERIAKGAIVIAQAPLHPLPAQIVRSLNNLYDIPEKLKGGENGN